MSECVGSIITTEGNGGRRVDVTSRMHTYKLQLPPLDFPRACVSVRAFVRLSVRVFLQYCEETRGSLVGKGASKERIMRQLH